jgi:hypothetical protein
MEFRYGGEINLFIYEDTFFEVDRWGNVWCVSEDLGYEKYDSADEIWSPKHGSGNIEEACKLWRSGHWDNMPIYEFLNGVFGE